MKKEGQIEVGDIYQSGEHRFVVISVGGRFPKKIKMLRFGTDYSMCEVEWKPEEVYRAHFIANIWSLY